MCARRNDIKHNDPQDNDIRHINIQHNDTQHKGLICNTQHNNTVSSVIMLSSAIYLLSCWMNAIMLSVIMLSVIMTNVTAPFTNKARSNTIYAAFFKSR